MYKVWCVKKPGKPFEIGEAKNIDSAISLGIDFRNGFFKAVPLWVYDLVAVDETGHEFYF